MLIGMVVSSTASILAVKCAKIVLFKLQKWNYYRNVAKRAAAQKHQLAIAMKNMKKEEREELLAHEDNRKNMKLFEHLNDKNPKKTYEFKRLVNIFKPDDIDGEKWKRCIDEEPLLID